MHTSLSRAQQHRYINLSRQPAVVIITISLNQSASSKLQIINMSYDRKPEGEWEHGLCGWAGCGNCMLAWCLPCVSKSAALLSNLSQDN